MSLAKGNHLLKLDKDGHPIRYEDESYIEWEIVELSPAFSVGPVGPDQTYDVEHVILLRKVK